MATKTFTDGVEVSNGEVVDSTEINQIAENTDHLKLNYLKVGYNLDSSDVGNGFEIILLKKAISETQDVEDIGTTVARETSLQLIEYNILPDIDSSLVESHVAYINNDTGVQRRLITVKKTVTLTMPSTSNENDAQTKGNTIISTFLSPIGQPVIVGATVTPDLGTVTYPRSLCYITSMTVTTITILCMFEFVADESVNEVTVSGTLHCAVIGTY